MRGVTSISGQRELDRLAEVSAAMVEANTACRRAYFAQFGSVRVPKSPNNPTGRKLTREGAAAARLWLAMPESGRISQWSKVLSSSSENLTSIARSYRGRTWLVKEFTESNRAANVEKSKRYCLEAAGKLLASYRTIPSIPPEGRLTKGWKPPPGFKPVVCPRLSELATQLRGLDPTKAATQKNLTDDVKNTVTDVKWIAIAAAAALLVWKAS